MNIWCQKFWGSTVQSDVLRISQIKGWAGTTILWWNVDQLDAVSVHLALNFACEDEGYELFWDRARIHVWMRGETICMI